MRLGPDFSCFGHKDISCRVRNRMLDKIVFRQSHGFFYCFSSACFFYIISSTARCQIKAILLTSTLAINC